MATYKPFAFSNKVAVAAQAAQDSNNKQRTRMRQFAQVVKNQTKSKVVPGKTAAIVSTTKAGH